MKSRTIAAAGLVAATLLGTSQPVLAQSGSSPDPVPAADPAPAPTPDTTVVSVFGTGITLSISVAATGHLTEVAITDATGAAPADAVATEVSPHEVKFLVGDTGTKIEVKADGKKVSTEVEALTVADLAGSHTWSGELFGPGNGVTELGFDVTEGPDGPMIDLTSLTGPGAGTEVVTFSTETDDHDEVEAKLTIRLTDAAGNEAKVTVKVKGEDDEAELKITAKSDFFGTEQAQGPVDDPTVNTPIVEDDDDDDYDDDDDHESDHDDDDGEDHDKDRGSNGNGHDDDD